MQEFLLGRGNGMHKQCICFSFAISARNVAITPKNGGCQLVQISPCLINLSIIIVCWVVI